MKKLEKDFQRQFGHWLKDNFKECAVFELKSCDTSCPFSAVQEHQMQGLLHAKHKSLYMKLPDVGLQMPFDCFFLKEVLAFIVIRYASGNWYAIGIDGFLRERDQSERKSLIADRAKEISTFHG